MNAVTSVRVYATFCCRVQIIENVWFPRKSVYMFVFMYKEYV